MAFEVETTGGRHVFDHLVLSTPLDETAKWFPFNEQERRSLPFGEDHLQWGDFRSSLVEARGWFRNGDTWCSEERVKDTATILKGHMIGARRTADKSPVAKARTAHRPDLYVCYQYNALDHSDDQHEDLLRQDLAAEGAEFQRTHHRVRWKYSPQLTAAAIRGGSVNRMDSRQGEGNLWITGATVAHETVDNIVDYNLRLTERMVRAIEGRSPSSEEAFESIARQFRYSPDDK